MLLTQLSNKDFVFSHPVHLTGQCKEQIRPEYKEIIEQSKNKSIEYF